MAVRLNHAVIGMTGEIGELAGAVERWLHYGKPLDRVNVAEELGDLMWYVALACNALGIDLGNVMEKNIAKLRVRYPDKYSDAHAAEENRDRAAERQVLAASNNDPDLAKALTKYKAPVRGPGMSETTGCDCLWDGMVHGYICPTHKVEGTPVG